MKSPPLFLTAFLLFATPALAQTAAQWAAGAAKQEAAGDTRKALQAYSKAYQLDPANADYMVKIAKQYGDLMTELNDPAQKKQAAAQSLAFSRQAVKVAPNQSDSHLALALSLGKMTEFMGNRDKIKNSREIKSEAELALRLNSKSDYAHHLLGRWHQEIAGMGGATRALAKLVYGGIPQGSYQAALQHFEAARKLRPDRLLHQIEYGRTLALMGQDALAETELNKGLAMPNKDKDDPEAKARGLKSLQGL